MFTLTPQGLLALSTHLHVSLLPQVRCQSLNLVTQLAQGLAAPRWVRSPNVYPTVLPSACWLPPAQHRRVTWPQPSRSCSGYWEREWRNLTRRSQTGQRTNLFSALGRVGLWNSPETWCPDSRGRSTEGGSLFPQEGSGTSLTCIWTPTTPYPKTPSRFAPQLAPSLCQTPAPGVTTSVILLGSLSTLPSTP